MRSPFSLGKIENEGGGKSQLPSIDQPDENEHEPKGGNKIKIT